MKVDDDARNEVVAALRDHLDSFYEEMLEHIRRIERAETVEEIMKAKRDLLWLWVVDLPTAATHCYFCTLYDMMEEGEDVCDKCAYAEHHGACVDTRSDYAKIREAAHVLTSAINCDYYRGEVYGDSSRPTNSVDSAVG